MFRKVDARQPRSVSEGRGGVLSLQVPSPCRTVSGPRGQRRRDGRSRLLRDRWAWCPPDSGRRPRLLCLRGSACPGSRSVSCVSNPADGLRLAAWEGSRLPGSTAARGRLSAVRRDAPFPPGAAASLFRAVVPALREAGTFLSSSLVALRAESPRSSVGPRPGWGPLLPGPGRPQPPLPAWPWLASCPRGPGRWLRA